MRIYFWTLGSWPFSIAKGEQVFREEKDSERLRTFAANRKTIKFDCLLNPLRNVPRAHALQNIRSGSTFNILIIYMVLKS